MYVYINNCNLSWMDRTLIIILYNMLSLIYDQTTIKKNTPPSSSKASRFWQYPHRALDMKNCHRQCMYILYIYCYICLQLSACVNLVYIYVARAQIIHYFKKKMTFRNIILCLLQPLHIYTYIVLFKYTSHLS